MGKRTESTIMGRKHRSKTQQNPAASPVGQPPADAGTGVSESEILEEIQDDGDADTNGAAASEVAAPPAETTDTAPPETAPASPDGQPLAASESPADPLGFKNPPPAEETEPPAAKPGTDHALVREIDADIAAHIAEKESIERRMRELREQDKQLDAEIETLHRERAVAAPRPNAAEVIQEILRASHEARIERKRKMDALTNLGFDARGLLKAPVDASRARRTGYGHKPVVVPPNPGAM